MQSSPQRRPTSIVPPCRAACRLDRIELYPRGARYCVNLPCCCVTRCGMFPAAPLPTASHNRIGFYLKRCGAPGIVNRPLPFRTPSCPRCEGFPVQLALPTWVIPRPCNLRLKIDGTLLRHLACRPKHNYKHQGWLPQYKKRSSECPLLLFEHIISLPFHARWVLAVPWLFLGF